MSKAKAMDTKLFQGQLQGQAEISFATASYSRTKQRILKITELSAVMLHISSCVLYLFSLCFVFLFMTSQVLEKPRPRPHYQGKAKTKTWPRQGQDPQIVSSRILEANRTVDTTHLFYFIVKIVQQYTYTKKINSYTKTR